MKRPACDFPFFSFFLKFPVLSGLFECLSYCRISWVLKVRICLALTFFQVAVPKEQQPKEGVHLFFSSSVQVQQARDCLKVGRMAKTFSFSFCTAGKKPCRHTPFYQSQTVGKAPAPWHPANTTNCNYQRKCLLFEGFAFCKDGEGRQGKNKTKQKKKVYTYTQDDVVNHVDTWYAIQRIVCERERERGREILAEQTFFTLASNKELLILCVWSGPGNHSSSNLMKVSSTAVSGLMSASEVTTNQLVIQPRKKKKKPYLDPNNSIFILWRVKRT